NGSSWLCTPLPRPSYAVLEKEVRTPAPVTSRRPPRYEQHDQARPRTPAHCAVCLLIPGGDRAKSVWPATDGVPAPAHAVAGNRSVGWSLPFELPHLYLGRSKDCGPGDVH